MTDTPAHNLTPRQLQVAQRDLRGWTNEDIADDLSIAASTVVQIRKGSYLRLGVHNKTEAILKLQAIGIEPVATAAG